MSIILVLGRDGIGAEQADDPDALFEDWCDYVENNISRVTGLLVTVETRGVRDVQTDEVRGAYPSDKQCVLDAIQELWESFCAEGGDS